MRLSFQEDLFLRTEGDNYYLRNHALLEDENRIKRDPALRLLRQTNVVPRHVLEVGASNGWRCEALRKLYHAHTTAVEPSAMAIRRGRRLFPEVAFHRGVAHSLPLPSGATYDLVIVFFVLHWVSRDFLLRSIAEIDARVPVGGHLLIGDFLPSVPTRVDYHHMPKKGYFTFKLDYLALLMATGLYKIRRRHVYPYDGKIPLSRDSRQEKAFCGLLKKVGERGYTKGLLAKGENKK